MVDLIFWGTAFMDCVETLNAKDSVWCKELLQAAIYNRASSPRLRKQHHCFSEDPAETLCGTRAPGKPHATTCVDARRDEMETRTTVFPEVGVQGEDMMVMSNLLFIMNIKFRCFVVYIVEE